ncbi:winged helix-turn-helix transcriptional regulator [Halosimplex rubrum]|uniref:Winged helix-turn-helix transcriptional regulator n=1 Tax=Halosimplex rubrum TaxID=869889 RepID=A0A7D5T8J5_9EURY|nr:winged helix-turn-helix transcriptional regulator [Halosimplex rubrum]
MNEAVEEEWVDETTPFERVYGVVRRTYDDESADEIAERARTSPTTARKHLRTLADAGEVATTEDGGTTLYRRSETAIVTEHAQSLLEDRSTEEISAGIADMKATIREWREAYGVDSPEEFARELAVADADSERGSVLTEWQTTRRNLALAQAALAIADARRDGHLTGRDDEDGGQRDSSLPV